MQLIEYEDKVLTKVVPASEMTNEQYHAAGGVSHSALNLFRRSRWEFAARYIMRWMINKRTPSMLLGTLVHAWVLEPQTFWSRYAVAPDCDRRTKEGKQTWAEFCASAGDREVIDRDTMNLAMEIGGRCYDNEFTSEILKQESVRESSHFWRCPDTGLLCKCRPDLYLPESNMIVDFKTCQDATPNGFVKSVETYGYHRQAAWYAWGFEVLTGRRPDFVFIAAQTSEPYEIGHYELDEEFLQIGVEQNRIALEQLADCVRRNSFTSKHQQGIVKLRPSGSLRFKDQYLIA